MWPDVFYSHKRAMGYTKYYPRRHISASQWNRATIPTAAPIFDNGHSNGTNGNTARLNRKWKILDSGLASRINKVACRRDRTTPTANSVLQMSGKPPKKNCDNLNQTGSLNCNMAVSKPEIPISQLPADRPLETKSQRLNLHFRGPAIEWD